jgi:hypothetical protein
LQIYQHRHTITNYNGQNLNIAHGFASIEDTDNTTYYVFDHLNQKVVMFNKYWEYQSALQIASFAYAISIDKELYILGNGIIHKRDKHLNLINVFNNAAVNYRGIYYNKSSDLIYIGTEASKSINIFNRNLTLLGNINTPGYTPYAFAEYNNEIFAGTKESIVLVFKNNVMIRSFNTVCGLISSIFIDSYGFILLLGFNSGYVYLYHTNGTYIIQGISTSISPFFMNFDSKGRLIITSNNDIKIYY